MNLIKADIRELWKNNKVVCITTNGFIKKNGQGVLGRGNALAMANLIPQLPIYLAAHIKKNGHIVGFIYKRIISFPVKPISGPYKDVLSHIKNRYKETDTNIPGFWLKASPSIIEKSIYQLNELLDFYDTLDEVYLPIPGVQNGQLNFEDIKSILEKGSSKIIYCSL